MQLEADLKDLKLRRSCPLKLHNSKKLQASERTTRAYINFMDFSYLWGILSERALHVKNVAAFIGRPPAPSRSPMYDKELRCGVHSVTIKLTSSTKWLESLKSYYVLERKDYLVLHCFGTFCSDH